MRFFTTGWIFGIENIVIVFALEKRASRLNLGPAITFLLYPVLV